MMKRLLLIGCLALWAWSPQTVQAECKVYTTAPVYIAGQAVPNVCNTAGAQWTSLVTPLGDSAMDETNDAAKVTLATLISGEDQTNSLLQTSGGAVRQATVTMGSAATANATTTAFALPTGSKSIYGQVAGTGAVTQTQAIYGDVDNDAANVILLCTITLSGTTRTQDACPVFTANYKYYYIITTNTTGTSATGAVYVHY
jgi:hypothetical protein